MPFMVIYAIIVLLLVTWLIICCTCTIGAIDNVINYGFAYMIVNDDSDENKTKLSYFLDICWGGFLDVTVGIISPIMIIAILTLIIYGTTVYIQNKIKKK